MATSTFSYAMKWRSCRTRMWMLGVLGICALVGRHAAAQQAASDAQPQVLLFHVPEEVPKGRVVGTISLPPELLRKEVVFVLLSGDEEQQFDLHERTGVLSAARDAGLDYETRREYELHVAIRDRQSAKELLAVVVRVVVENRPEWMLDVDRFFGRWLVQPLAAVLFYDFGTSRWLRIHGEGVSVPFVVAWLFCGAVFFTLRMGFINLRGFWHAVRLTKGDYDDPEHAGEVSHFQALASALSATVGLGNIAGVAIAVGMGGPGAIFWLIVAGFLGMSSKFSECSLGMLYRKIDPDGTVSGGPMHYLSDGLRELKLAPLGRVLAVMFAVMCIGGSLGGGCAFQVGQSLGAVEQQLPWLADHRWAYGLFMAVMVGIVIIGGIRRIAATADKIVPLMCGLYVLSCLYILATNYNHILPAFQTILDGAWSGRGVAGGVVGVAIIGIRRAAFSNEAGVGSASIAHSAAKTEQPISEGIVALLEPFIDTVVICTMTGLVIVVTGCYDKSVPAYAALMAANKGAQLTSLAFNTAGTIFPWILSAVVVLFAYSTAISWSYYGERCWSWLLGRRYSLAYRLLFLVFVMLGSIVTEGNILEFSDLMILAMAFPNVLGVALLSGRLRQALDVYWQLYKSGALEPRRGVRPEAAAG
ncbi:MAG: amino acid carrier protein [Pirellulales bacterium]|nr:amino acid carrier protein [Pirellulales bacterium]